MAASPETAESLLHFSFQSPKMKPNGSVRRLFSSHQECLEFFNIPEARSAHYFLMDKRWNLIHYNKVERSGELLWRGNQRDKQGHFSIITLI